MIGLDTNVLLRLLVGDDAAAQRAVKDFLLKHCSADEPAWVDRVVAVETVWVLERRYAYDRQQIADAFSKLLDTAEIAFQDHDLLRTALLIYRKGAGFADALIAESNQQAGCRETITFDADAAKRIPHFSRVSA